MGIETPFKKIQLAVVHLGSPTSQLWNIVQHIRCLLKVPWNQYQCVLQCWVSGLKPSCKTSSAKSLVSPAENSKTKMFFFLYGGKAAETIPTWEVAERNLQMALPAAGAKSPSPKGDVCPASPCSITLI